MQIRLLPGNAELVRARAEHYRLSAAQVVNDAIHLLWGEQELVAPEPEPDPVPEVPAPATVVHRARILR